MSENDDLIKSFFAKKPPEEEASCTSVESQEVPTDLQEPPEPMPVPATDDPLADPDYLAEIVNRVKQDAGLEVPAPDPHTLPRITLQEAPASLRNLHTGETQFILCADGQPIPLASNPKRTLLISGQVYSIRSLSQA